MFYNCDNVNETRTVKTGGGLIGHILIGERGSTGAFIKVYDGTSDAGSLIASVDTNKADSWLSFEQEFTIGLTYVTTGNPGNFTLFYK